MATLAGHRGAFYSSRRMCLQLEAADETITVSDPAGGELDFALTADFSIEMWVKIAVVDDGLVLDKYSATDYGYMIEVDGTGHFEFTIGDGTNTPSIVGGTAVNDNKWHHLLCVRDASVNDKLYMYLDGASDAAGVADTTTGTLANAEDLVVGPTDTECHRDVIMFRIFDSAISAANAAKLYAGDWPQLDAYVVGSWACIEGSGTSVLDDSANRNNAVVSAAAAINWAAAGYDTEAAEVPTGAINAVNKTYTLAYTNVDCDGVTITVDAVALTKNGYTLTPKGTIVCVTAPAASITVTYNHYPATLEAGEFFGWTFDYTADVLDTTTFGNTARTYLGNLTGWTGSAECYVVNAGNACDVGSKLIVKFYHDETGAERLEGWGYVSGVSRDVEPGAIVHQSVNFQGTDDVGIEST